jgi:hypothetical protein
MRALALACLLLATAASATRAEGIWAALVLGTDEQPPKPAPKVLAPYAAGMKTVFGTNTFYLLGDRLETIAKGDEEWVVPTKRVNLKLRCLDRASGAYTLRLELYVGKREVLASDVRLTKGAPLYIRGPAWGRGRLVFILEVK